MKTNSNTVEDTIHKLKHYLPAQAPLKDFIHHNTLHAFQHYKFEEALLNASEIFGYKVVLSLNEYRNLYKSGRIKDDVLNSIIVKRKGESELSAWKENVLYKNYNYESNSRIGSLRSKWKEDFNFDVDKATQPILFRIICSYLDQGISIWNFPSQEDGFIKALIELEKNSFISFFNTKEAKELLQNKNTTISSMLKLVVGEEELYEHYLFDQQFSHQGWSGLVSAIEDQPNTLLDKKPISLNDLIFLELILEIDALTSKYGNKWKPLGQIIKVAPQPLFDKTIKKEVNEVFEIWQEAFEWSYYDEVLNGLSQNNNEEVYNTKPSFQGMFCIDDRECSFRRYLETEDPKCKTYSTAGFFGIEFYFQPENGKFVTKLCPAPITPKYLIKEVGSKQQHKKDLSFVKHSHGLFGGWIISQTLGFWSALKLFFNIFRPSMGPATASSFKQMDKHSHLTIQCENPSYKEDGLQVGFTIDEMSQRVEGVLKSIGLTTDFAPLVYVVGHGSSSVNNPHFAAYDCGACSGRPGSVNARVFCFMANHQDVRRNLMAKGITIPSSTQFVGGLHDTTRDEIVFFDEHKLTELNKEMHQKNEITFLNALSLNAKERSRRFELINTKESPETIHEQVKLRSVSLFEPRPEYNHATNAFCIIGRRELSKGLFLDRRAFLNSYDYRIDEDGRYLQGILKAAAPVCGGINLEYFFSRVDNQKLGAGSKLPHNVMGLFGVANGIDGDLRPGLPKQMIEIHDPVRLMIVIEHFPNPVLEILKRDASTYEWFLNNWIHLVVIHPDTKELYYFKDGSFANYLPTTKSLIDKKNINELIEQNHENIAVHKINI